MNMGLTDIVKGIIYRPGGCTNEVYEVLRNYQNGASLRKGDEIYVGTLLSQNTGFHEDEETGELHETAHLSVDGKSKLYLETIVRNRFRLFLYKLIHEI